MKSYRAAGFWVRFWAYIIDLICVLVLSSVTISILSSVFKIPQQYLGWMKMSFLMVGLIGFVYFTIMTRFWGQTIGKMICGIMVIKTNGEDMDWTTAIVREVAGRTISQFFGSHLGYLVIPFIPKKLSCHDLLCDTYVVHVDEFEKNRWINITTEPVLNVNVNSVFQTEVNENEVNEIEVNTDTNSESEDTE
ncbi:UNVERIFIED_CONTAM: putative RDD family membrane protein YckC [Acetivibrio alkalicellulosi]